MKVAELNGNEEKLYSKYSADKRTDFLYDKLIKFNKLSQEAKDKYEKAENNENEKLILGMRNATKKMRITICLMYLVFEAAKEEETGVEHNLEALIEKAVAQVQMHTFIDSILSNYLVSPHIIGFCKYYITLLTNRSKLLNSVALNYFNSYLKLSEHNKAWELTGKSLLDMVYTYYMKYMVSKDFTKKFKPTMIKLMTTLYEELETFSTDEYAAVIEANIDKSFQSQIRHKEEQKLRELKKEAAEQKKRQLEETEAEQLRARNEQIIARNNKEARRKIDEANTEIKRKQELKKIEQQQEYTAKQKQHTAIMREVNALYNRVTTSSRKLSKQHEKPIAELSFQELYEELRYSKLYLKTLSSCVNRLARANHYIEELEEEFNKRKITNGDPEPIETEFTLEGYATWLLKLYTKQTSNKLAALIADICNSKKGVCDTKMLCANVIQTLGDNCKLFNKLHNIEVQLEKLRQSQTECTSFEESTNRQLLLDKFKTEQWLLHTVLVSTMLDNQHYTVTPDYVKKLKNKLDDIGTDKVYTVFLTVDVSGYKNNMHVYPVNEREVYSNNISVNSPRWLGSIVLHDSMSDAEQHAMNIASQDYLDVLRASGTYKIHDSAVSIVELPTDMLYSICKLLTKEAANV